MATDWSARTEALEYFENLLRILKRANDDDKEHYQQAVNALRRSQDHTAIQTKLNSVMLALRDLESQISSYFISINDMPEELREIVNAARVQINGKCVDASSGDKRS